MRQSKSSDWGQSAGLPEPPVWPAALMSESAPAPESEPLRVLAWEQRVAVMVVVAWESTVWVQRGPPLRTQDHPRH